MPRTLEGTERPVILSVRVGPRLYDRLRQRAMTAELTVPELMRLLLMEGLGRDDSVPRAPRPDGEAA